MRELSNGDIYVVQHPELMALGTNVLSLSYDPDNDLFAHVALIHINAIKPSSPAPRKRRAS